REGIAATAALKVTNNWSFISSAVVDLDRHLQAKEALRQGVSFATKPSTSRFALSSMSLGLQYKDECTIFSIVYTASGFRDGYNGLTQPSRSILARLEFRTLGEIAFKQSLNALQDGL
ncbi:MAG: hypothetical protein ACRCYS_18465, partial [Beijerinckiaceae bacterium]